MRYNAKYNRWFSKEGLVYKLDKNTHCLVLCKTYISPKGYERFNCCVLGIEKCVFVHRAVYETFNGEIPDGMQIDHINTQKTDNSLENLKVCTSFENANNPLTKEHVKLANKKVAKIPRTVFGKLFKDHFGISPIDNKPLYYREQRFYNKHNKCSWEA